MQPPYKPTVRPIVVTPQALCLLCSSSILFPSASRTSGSATHPTPSSTSHSSATFVTTTCCSRIICSTCVDSNRRSVSWNPCLACEGRWSKQHGGQKGASLGNRSVRPGGEVEVDGDDDVLEKQPFVLGDSDDEGDEVDVKVEDQGGASGVAVAAVPGTIIDPAAKPEVEPHEPRLSDDDRNDGSQPAPAPGEIPSPTLDGEAISKQVQTHTVLKGETLMGIALKYRLDPMALLHLNNLPHSALYTMPHLVQTRHTLLLTSSSAPDETTPAAQRIIAHERALARFAKVTKEQDADVRRVYVGLAEAGLEDDDGGGRGGEEDGGIGWSVIGDREKQEKPKERSGVQTGDTTTNRAVNRFFEDEQWERTQLGSSSSASASASSTARIRPFPIVGSSASSAWTGHVDVATCKGKGKEAEGNWWSRWSGLGGGTTGSRQQGGIVLGPQAGFDKGGY